MPQINIETLNIIHQVLKHMMLSLAAADRTDMAALGRLLESAASNQALEPMAQTMLADLAAGATALGTSGCCKQ